MTPKNTSDIDIEYHHTTRAAVHGGAPPTLRSRVHFLDSIPLVHRFPGENLTNTTSYFLNWEKGTSPDILFEYNPSLILLPLTARSEFTVESNGKDTKEIKPAYLASFRVSSVHSCGIRTYAFWETGASRNFLGLALLDTQLNMVKGSDIVLDFNRIFSPNRFEDFRLHLLNDTIFLSSSNLLLPIQISSPKKINKDYWAQHGLPNLFGNGMVVSILTEIKSVAAKGKNFQYFSASDDKRSYFLLECWPSGPREVLALNHSSLLLKTNSREQSTLSPLQSFITEVVPNPSVSLHAEINRKFTSRDRGTACCVYLDYSYFDHLTNVSREQERGGVLVGISHSKTHKRMRSSQGSRYNYLSRWYAFLPTPPFSLVARSGLFCFGFPRHGRNMTVKTFNVILEATERKQLEINGISYSCPNIHFVSGMSEKADDTSKAIIGMGINDCVSNFIELDKRNIGEQLFRGGVSFSP